MPDVREGDAVPNVLVTARVIDANGARVTLGSFWSDRACLVVFLRHFGCYGCGMQVAELAPRIDELVRAGVRVVLVGNGTASQMTAFRERHALDGAAIDLVTDPDLEAYRAAGLHRSTWGTYGPRAIVEAMRAIAAGIPHRGYQGDATQQGGAMLVDARGTVRLVRRSRSLGDHAPTSDLVEAAMRLAIETRSEAIV